jgi:hypothetical protein
MMRLNLIATLTGLLLAALCGCSTAGASPSATPSANDDQIALHAGTAFAQCVRQHGAPTFPDPALVNGQLAFPGADQQLNQALHTPDTTCRALLEQVPAAMRSWQQTITAADLANLLRFAQCLRGHGLGDWPDPRSDGTFPIVGTPLQQEGKSARFVAAAKACQQYWDKAIGIS